MSDQRSLIHSKLIDLRDWANTTCLTIIDIKFELSMTNADDIDRINELTTSLAEEKQLLEEYNIKICSLMAICDSDEKKQQKE
jgi:hypothetical protein